MARTRSRSTTTTHSNSNKKPRRNPEREHPRPFDIQAFPHILEAVIDAASPEVLRALRATCREIFREINRRERHLSLVQMPEIWPPKGDELSDVDLTEEEREKRLPRPVWSMTPSGVRRAWLPDETDVLDIDGWVSRLWLKIIEPNMGLWDKDGEDIYGYNTEDGTDSDEDPEYQFGMRRVPLTEHEREIRRWLRRNEELFYGRFNPRLVRYPDGFDDNRKAIGALKPDPCAVYFCDFGDFLLGLYHLESHYSDWAGARGAYLDTVFNVKLVGDDWSKDPWNHMDPANGYDVILRSNALTMLFEMTPEFVESVEDHWDEPKFLVGLLKLVTRNFMVIDEEDEGRPGEGKATLVGYDTWPLSVLPDPSERDGAGPPANAAECVRRWVTIHVADVKEEAQEKGLKLTRPEDELNDPIRLLSLEEWRQEIGEEYFKLMTDKKYQYESKKPLPPFKRHPSVEPLSLIGHHNAGDRWIFADGLHTLESKVDLANVKKVVQCRW